MKKQQNSKGKLGVRKERVRNLSDDMVKQVNGAEPGPNSCPPGTGHCGPFTRPPE